MIGLLFPRRLILSLGIRLEMFDDRDDYIF